MSVKEQAQLIALTDIDGIGDKRALELIETIGSLQSVFDASFETLAGLHYVDRDTYKEIQNIEESVEEYEDRIDDAISQGISLITPLDEAYPNNLRNHHSPLILFIRGNEDLLSADTARISFAGSRDTNEVGTEWTHKISTALVNEGYCIVSGGAFGVDESAHEAALNAGGDTIIVSPSGHNNPYPGANSDLFAQVEKNGLVVSHRFPDQEPTRGGFIYRNRTNSALGSGIVISAAGSDGGSMSQFEIAIDQNKSVFVPEQELGAEPEAGLSEMRTNDLVTTVDSVQDILSVLRSTEGQQTLDDL